MTDKTFQDLVSNFILQTLFLLCNPQYQSTEGIIPPSSFTAGCYASTVYVVMQCLTHSYILPKRINIPSKLFHISGSHTIRVFHTKRLGNIPTGTPVMGHRMPMGQAKISILNKYLALRSVTVALYFSISHLAAGFLLTAGIAGSSATRYKQSRSTVNCVYDSKARHYAEDNTKKSNCMHR